MELFYSIYNRHRLPNFQIETCIIKENSIKKVVKKALTSDACNHINHIYDSYFSLKDSILNENIKLPEILDKKSDSISFEFIEGESFDKILFRAFLNKDKQEFLGLIDEYYNFLYTSFKTSDKLIITDKTRNIFHDLNLDLVNKERFFFSVSYLDPILDNIILHDGIYYLIDNEWIFQGSFPISFVFFRGILSFYIRKNSINIENFISFNEILKNYNLSNEIIETYNIIEERFSEYVFGKTKQYNIKNNYRKKLLTIEKVIAEKDEKIINLTPQYFAQLFIDTGPGFIEEYSIRKIIKGHEKELEFDIGNYNNVKAIRFDPLNNPVKIRLEQVKIITANNKLHVDLLCNTNALYKKENVFIFDTDDPRIHINLKDIFKPQKIFIKLEYMSWGMDVYKHICEEHSFIINKINRDINFKEEVIEKKDKEIEKLENTLYEKEKEIKELKPVYLAQLFIDTGSGFISEQSLIKEIDGRKDQVEFDITEYNNIKSLRFDPLDTTVSLKINRIKIINKDNKLYSNINYQTNALYQKNDIFIFETHDPIIEIDTKHIINPQKLIIDLEYINWGEETYKDICREKSIFIQEKDKQISEKDKQISEKDKQISEKDKQISEKDKQISEKDKQISEKDKQISEKSAILERVIEKDKILDDIYHSHGWKLLSKYYKLRDFLLPENSISRKLTKLLFTLPSNLKKRLRNISIHVDKIELTYDSIEISGWALSHSGIKKIELYIDDKYINNITYGLPRPDVGHEYHFIKNSINSGFYLSMNLAPVYIRGSNHIIKIKGINSKNESKEILINLSSTGFTRPKIIIDKTELYNDTLYISGWAISDDIIDKIEIYLADEFIGNAIYGHNRADVKVQYPSINKSEKSGFYLSKSIKNLQKDIKEYNMKIKVITNKGFFNEVSTGIIKKNLWSDKNEPDKNELKKQKTYKFSHEPKISIITPTYNTPKQFLIDMIESVLNQTYSKWELCIADGSSMEHYVKNILENYQNKDKRIKVKLLTENKGIAGNSNEALSMATGDFMTLLDHDDTLTPYALFEIVKVINEHPDVDFIYSDEDKITEDGERRFDHYFKPDWSPDTLKSYNYPIHVSVFSKDTIKLIGGFRDGFEGSQDYDLILRVTEKAKNIIHIPKILYHWRVNKNSTAGDTGAKLYAYVSAKKALEEHLQRTGLKGEVKDGLWPGTKQVTYEITKLPKISIIILNKNHYEDLKKCINSIINKSSYKNFEIIIMENGSDEENIFDFYKELKRRENIRIITWNDSFNYAAINNFAVNYAKGEILLFLNNDIEIINQDWIERMLEHAVRKEIGAVGAKLYYPDNTIQHGGVIIGIQGAAGHAHKNYHKDSPGYFARLKVIQNLSAVTAACVMIRKEVFKEIEGFDERYTIAFNDVDLCLKIREKGYLIIWTPYAELYHYESKTRGLEDTPEKQERAKKEVELLRTKWKDILDKGDPYYNPNLTLDKEDFSLKYN